MMRLFSWILILGSLLLTAAVGDAQERPVSKDEGATRLRLFAPAWRGVGGQSPALVTRNFEILYLSDLSAEPFKAANPAVICAQYTLGPYGAKEALKRLPDEVFVHDAEGKVIKARTGRTGWWFRITRSGWTTSAR